METFLVILEIIQTATAAITVILAILAIVKRKELKTIYGNVFESKTNIKKHSDISDVMHDTSVKGDVIIIRKVKQFTINEK